jgi:hypothetical protein
MYLLRNSDNIPAFKSVILAGVTDIKNLKRKIRPDTEHAINSPWNIATSFTLDMSFKAVEIATMLKAYENDYHSGMDIKTVAEQIYFWTSGYPFLVSDIAKTIAENIQDEYEEDPAPLSWDKNGVDTAAKLIIGSPNLLFDDMIKNLDNNPDFGRLTEKIVLEGLEVRYDPNDTTIAFGMMYGIYTQEKNHKVAISNKIFETALMNYYSTKNDIRLAISNYVDYRPQFIHDGILDMETILSKFSAFMKSEYREEDSDFIEREGRLLFLSFLRPIINGSGNYAVEAETRGARRMDLVVFYGGKEYIVELKIWRGESYEEEGIAQLASYLKARGQKQGWLLSYANLKKSPRKGGILKQDGVEIYEEIVAYRDKE